MRKEGALLLFRAYKGLPKNGALIKFLSQEGMKNTMLQTEAYYLQDNASGVRASSMSTESTSSTMA